MDAAQALAELRELSSQVRRAAVLDADGALLAASPPGGGEGLAAAARELLAVAGELHAGVGEVVRVEVELAEGGLFVLREGGLTAAAVTGPRPTAGLVVYDLRTCLRGIEAPAAKTGRGRRRKHEEAAE